MIWGQHITHYYIYFLSTFNEKYYIQKEQKNGIYKPIKQHFFCFFMFIKQQKGNMSNIKISHILKKNCKAKMHHDLDRFYVYIWLYKNIKITSIPMLYLMVFVDIDKNTQNIHYLSNFNVVEMPPKISIKMMFWKSFFDILKKSEKRFKTKNMRVL